MMSSEKKPPSTVDTALFHEAMKQVRPLQLNNNRIEPARCRPSPRPRRTEQEQALQEIISTPLDHAEIETEDELLFLRPGIQHSMLRKLRRGQYGRGAELDLHGMTVPIAHQTLAEFLHYCQTQGVSCARIIHGKGHGSRQRKPVLKNRINLWLRQRDEVLAFCSARPEDGGTGAIYVLIKRN